MTNTTRITYAAALLAALLFVGACYTSKFPLGTAEQAKVDKKYVGDWDLPDPESPAKPPTSLRIRNIDDHQYYVEFDEHNDKGPQRYSGFVTDVKGVPFAQLRPLTDDGEVSEVCFIVRVGTTGDCKLTIRQLADYYKFFKDKPI